MEKEKLRLDKYLWAIRIYKTRSLAAEACDKGRVKFNGDTAKASKTVQTGDVFEIKTSDRKWVIKVKERLFARLKYSEAVLYYEDQTPAEELERIKFEATAFHTGKRMSKIGRPTKKNKRDLDAFLGEG